LDHRELIRIAAANLVSQFLSEAPAAELLTDTVSDEMPTQMLQLQFDQELADSD